MEVDPEKKDKEFDYANHLKNVEQQIEKIRKDYRLDDMLNKNDLLKHAKTIYAFLDKYHRQFGINVELEPESLIWLNTMHYSDLNDVLTGPFKMQRIMSFIKNREKTDFMYLRFAIEPLGNSMIDPRYNPLIVNLDEYKEYEKGPVLVSTLYQEQAEIVGMSTSLEKINTLAIHKSLNKFKRMMNEVKLSMNEFIRDNELLVHFSQEFLTERQNEIVTWLWNEFKENNQIVSFNPASTKKILEHLFTNLHISGTRVLDAQLTVHPEHQEWRCKGSSLIKREIVFFCYTYNYDDPFLVEQFENNTSVFANQEDYRQILRRKTKPTIQLLYIKVNGHVVSMYVIHESEFAKIEASARARKKLHLGFLEHEDDFKMRERPERDEQKMLKMANDSIERCIERIPSLINHPNCEAISLAEGVVYALSKQAVMITDNMTGLDGAIKTVNGCIEHLCGKVNSVFDAKGRNAFPGNLSLTRGTVEISDFDNNKKRKWGAVVKGIMNDKDNEALVQSHRERNLSVRTLNMMSGNNAITTSILPCTTTTNIYNFNNQNNNTTIINHYDTSVSSKIIHNLKQAIQELATEEDPDVKKAIVEECLTSGHFRKKRRKRTISGEETEKIKKMVRVCEEKKEKKTLATNTSTTEKTSSESDHSGDNDNDMEIEKNQNVEVDNAVDDHHENNDEDSVCVHTVCRNIVIKGTGVVNPNLSGLKKCPCCDEDKNLHHFYYTSKPANQDKIYEYMRNVCNSCTSKKQRIDTKIKNLKKQTK